MGHKNQVPVILNWQSTDPATGFLPTHPNGGSAPSGSATGTMATTAVLYSQIIDISRMDSLGLELDWTSTPVGAFVVLASVSGKKFYDITALFATPAITNPSGSNSGTLGGLKQSEYKYVYVKYTNASSSGVLTGYLQCKDLN